MDAFRWLGFFIVRLRSMFQIFSDAYVIAEARGYLAFSLVVVLCYGWLLWYHNSW
jgi:hypothetical protein